MPSSPKADIAAFSFDSSHRFLTLPFREDNIGEKWELGREVLTLVLRLVLAYTPEDADFSSVQPAVGGPSSGLNTTQSSAAGGFFHQGRSAEQCRVKCHLQNICGPLTAAIVFPRRPRPHPLLHSRGF